MRRNIAATITLLDKAPEADAGGNTRWTPSYMRMAAVDRVEPSFVHDMLEATGFKGDEDYFATLAAHAPATVQWIAAHGVPFHQPVYYLAKGPPRIQPIGGGETIHRELTRAARGAGVVFRFDCAADALIAEDGAIAGVRLTLRRDAARRAVVLACGGFQANAAMMREHFGPAGDDVPLLAPRAHFNSGDGIRMAQALGADLSGEPDGMHIEPVDPRVATRRRWCCSIPTASSSTATAAASSTRARASSTRPGRRFRAACISRCRAGSPSRSSTPASARSPTGSAPRAPRCRRSRPRRSPNSPS